MDFYKIVTLAVLCSTTSMLFNQLKEVQRIKYLNE